MGCALLPRGGGGGGGASVDGLQHGCARRTRKLVTRDVSHLLRSPLNEVPQKNSCNARRWECESARAVMLRAQAAGARVAGSTLSTRLTNMSVFFDTSQFDKSLLNLEARLNMPCRGEAVRT